MSSFSIIIKCNNNLHYCHSFNNNDADELVNFVKTVYNQYNFNSIINSYHISIYILSIFIKKLMKDKKYYTHKKKITFDKNKLMYVSNLGLYKNYNKIKI